ncbi:hypothetical protein BAC1_02198 [uncultured bacterium]|nr:hypothetical protein BAC1_02198 [uncultured bacterium]
MTYKYQFSSINKDLMDAHKAERTFSLGMRAFFRWLIAMYGAVSVSLSLVALDFNKSILQQSLSLIFGLVLLYFFAVKPVLKRFSIKRNNASSQEITLVFTDDYLRIQISGLAEITRQWDEFSGFNESNKGILFYFTDGIVNWLPNRAFFDNAERTKFIEFLQSHLFNQKNDISMLLLVVTLLNFNKCC